MQRHTVDPNRARLHARVVDVADWMNHQLRRQEMEIDLGEGNIDEQIQAFFAQLKDGVLLCKLMQSVAPATCSKLRLDARAGSEEAAHNIEQFLYAAQANGVPRLFLFDVGDLSSDHVQNPNLILSTLVRLARLSGATLKTDEDGWNEKSITGGGAATQQDKMRQDAAAQQAKQRRRAQQNALDAPQEREAKEGEVPGQHKPSEGGSCAQVGRVGPGHATVTQPRIAAPIASTSQTAPGSSIDYATPMRSPERKQAERVSHVAGIHSLTPMRSPTSYITNHLAPSSDTLSDTVLEFSTPPPPVTFATALPTYTIPEEANNSQVTHVSASMSGHEIAQFDVEEAEREVMARMQAGKPMPVGSPHMTEEEKWATSYSTYN